MVDNKSPLHLIGDPHPHPPASLAEQAKKRPKQPNCFRVGKDLSLN